MPELLIAVALMVVSPVLVYYWGSKVSREIWLITGNRSSLFGNYVVLFQPLLLALGDFVALSVRLLIAVGDFIIGLPTMFLAALIWLITAGGLCAFFTPVEKGRSWSINPILQF